MKASNGHSSVPLSPFLVSSRLSARRPRPVPLAVRRAVWRRLVCSPRPCVLCGGEDIKLDANRPASRVEGRGEVAY